MDGVVKQSVIDITHESKRIEWVDLCKGFAMILVMVGHASFPNWLISWLYSFHIPLFFFLSGYVFSVDRYKNFKSFLWRKVKTLLIPAIVLGWITSLIKYIISSTGDFWSFLVKKVLAVLIQLRGSDYDVGLWFFVCLFVVEIAFWILLKITRNKTGLWMMLLVLAAVVGYVYHYTIGRICPWSLDVACIAIGFFGFGFWMRKYGQKVFCKLASIPYALILWAINILFAWLQTAIFHGVSDLYAQAFGIPVLCHVAALSGVLASVTTFEIIRKANALSYIGKNTIVFYSFHGVVYAMLSKFVFNDTADTFWRGLIYLGISLIVCSGLSFIINRYAPWIVGKRKEKSA